MRVLASEEIVAFRRCLDTPQQAHTLPPAAYADAELFEREQELIFRRGWVGVGRGDRWPNVGDFASVDIGGVPIIVVRSDEGLRAHANTCRHRGSMIVSGEGNCARMRCPFHAWTYSLDGRLVGAPDMHRTPGFDKTDQGLHEFTLEQRHGFVFVSLDPDPPSIDDWFGDFDPIHTLWPLDQLVMTHRRQFTVDCNWKAFAEVFNEYYHLPYVHPGSIDDMYDNPDDPEEVKGSFATQFGATSGSAAILGDDEEQALPLIPGLSGREAQGVRYTWLYPNIVTALGVDCMWMYEVYPDGPNRCRVAQVVAFPPETVAAPDFDAKVGEYYRRFDVAIDEDIPILERQQLGLQSPFAEQGRFSWLEPSVAAFARWYAERMLAV